MEKFKIKNHPSGVVEMRMTKYPWPFHRNVKLTLIRKRGAPFSKIIKPGKHIFKDFEKITNSKEFKDSVNQNPISHYSDSNRFDHVWRKDVIPKSNFKVDRTVSPFFSLIKKSMFDSEWFWASPVEENLGFMFSKWKRKFVVDNEIYSGNVGVSHQLGVNAGVNYKIAESLFFNKKVKRFISLKEYDKLVQDFKLINKDIDFDGSFALKRMSISNFLGKKVSNLDSNVNLNTYAMFKIEPILQVVYPKIYSRFKKMFGKVGNSQQFVLERGLTVIKGGKVGRSRVLNKYDRKVNLDKMIKEVKPEKTINDKQRGVMYLNKFNNMLKEAKIEFVVHSHPKWYKFYKDRFLELSSKTHKDKVQFMPDSQSVHYIKMWMPEGYTGKVVDGAKKLKGNVFQKGEILTGSYSFKEGKNVIDVVIKGSEAIVFKNGVRIYKTRFSRPGGYKWTEPERVLESEHVIDEMPEVRNELRDNSYYTKLVNSGVTSNVKPYEGLKLLDYVKDMETRKAIKKQLLLGSKTIKLPYDKYVKGLKYPLSVNRGISFGYKPRRDINILNYRRDINDINAVKNQIRLNRMVDDIHNYVTYYGAKGGKHKVKSKIVEKKFNPRNYKFELPEKNIRGEMLFNLRRQLKAVSKEKGYRVESLKELSKKDYDEWVDSLHFGPRLTMKWKRLGPEYANDIIRQGIVKGKVVMLKGEPIDTHYRFGLLPDVKRSKAKVSYLLTPNGKVISIHQEGKKVPQFHERQDINFYGRGNLYGKDVELKDKGIRFNPNRYGRHLQMQSVSSMTPLQKVAYEKGWLPEDEWNARHGVYIKKRDKMSVDAINRKYQMIASRDDVGQSAVAETVTRNEIALPEYVTDKSYNTMLNQALNNMKFSDRFIFEHELPQVYNSHYLNKLYEKIRTKTESKSLTENKGVLKNKNLYKNVMKYRLNLFLRNLNKNQLLNKTVSKLVNENISKVKNISQLRNKVLSKVKTKVVNKVVSKHLLKNKVVSKLIDKLIQKQITTIVTTTKTPPPSIPIRIVPPSVPPPVTGGGWKRKEYNDEVNEVILYNDNTGDWDVGPITKDYELGVAVGSEIVDKTKYTKFRVRKNRRRSRSLFSKAISNPPINKFNMQGDVFVEKNIYRLDSLHERRGNFPTSQVLYS